ncbi:MAG: Crp/Fnr family transcriptional regulator [Bacteriovoracia bacterium]
MEQIIAHEHFGSQNTSSKRLYKKGEVVYYEDTPSFGFFYVSKGTIKIFTQDSQGREVILRLAKTGDIFGHAFLFGQRNHINSAKAVEETECDFVEGVKFQSTIINNPGLGFMVMKKIGKELSLFQNRCVDLMKKNVRERLASYFYYMSLHHSENDEDGLKINVQLSREEIASIIGTANETAIRFISEFKELGLIREEDRFFHILDKERLANMGRLE